MKKVLYFLVLFFSFTFYCHAEKLDVTLDKCVDGDTAWFILDGESIKVRFLAIDTPETVHPTKEVEAYGKDASEFTCNSLESSNNIQIEYDPGSDKKDKYDRDLVWVFVNNELLQSKLVEIGYAKVAYIYGDYLYTDLLYEKEEYAKENSLGLWSESSNEVSEYTININGYELTFNKANVSVIAILLIIVMVLYINKCKIRVKFKNK